MAVPNSSYASDFVATTLNKFEPVIRSEILDHTLLLKLAKEKMLEERDGGANISVPLIYDDNDTFKAYEEDGDLDLSLQTGATNADYPWRQYGGSVVIPNIDLFKNGNSKAKMWIFLSIRRSSLLIASHTR